MKNGLKNIVLLTTGVVIGAVIADPVAQAAEMFTAQRSTQKALYCSRIFGNLEAVPIAPAPIFAAQNAADCVKKS